MEGDELRRMLSSVRPGGQDDGNPQFSGVFRRMKEDPELERWFQWQRAVDRVIASKLSEIVPPPSLKPNLLSLWQEVPVVSWWYRPWVWAVGTCVVFGLSAWLLTLPTNRGLPPSVRFEEAMVRQIEATPQFENVYQRSEEALRWLTEKRKGDSSDFPFTLPATGEFGCTTLSWEGHPVALICLSWRGKHAHLFVVEEQALEPGAAWEKPQFRRIGAWDTALWKRDGKVYLLLGLQEEGTVRDFFGG